MTTTSSETHSDDAGYERYKTRDDALAAEPDVLALFEAQNGPIWIDWDKAIPMLRSTPIGIALVHSFVTVFGRTPDLAVLVKLNRQIRFLQKVMPLIFDTNTFEPPDRFDVMEHLWAMSCVLGYASAVVDMNVPAKSEHPDLVEPNDMINLNMRKVGALMFLESVRIAGGQMPVGAMHEKDARDPAQLAALLLGRMGGDTPRGQG